MDLFEKFPDLPKYKMSVLTETGAQFSLGIQLMQLFSEKKTNFAKLTGILGLYYQISNDYHSLCRQEVTSEILVLDILICPCV
jgi:geranylgeranyl diphosphate synthase type 3